MVDYEGWLFIEDVNNGGKREKIRHYFRGPKHISVCQRAQAADMDGIISPVPEEDRQNCRICRNILRHERLVRGAWHE